MNTYVKKPWGSYQIIEEGSNYLVKNITVKPGGQLSLQSHNNRSEHWVVVQGTAEVTIDANTKHVQENESIFIPKNSKHRLANKLSEDLIVVEIWYGDHLDEEDIIRYEDIYNRLSS